MRFVRREVCDVRCCIVVVSCRVSCGVVWCCMVSCGVVLCLCLCLCRWHLAIPTVTTYRCPDLLSQALSGDLKISHHTMRMFDTYVSESSADFLRYSGMRRPADDPTHVLLLRWDREAGVVMPEPCPDVEVEPTPHYGSRVPRYWGRRDRRVDDDDDGDSKASDATPSRRSGSTVAGGDAADRAVGAAAAAATTRDGGGGGGGAIAAAGSSGAGDAAVVGGGEGAGGGSSGGDAPPLLRSLSEGTDAAPSIGASALDLEPATRTGAKRLKGSSGDADADGAVDAVLRTSSTM